MQSKHDGPNQRDSMQHGTAAKEDAKNKEYHQENAEDQARAASEQNSGMTVEAEPTGASDENTEATHQGADKGPGQPPVIPSESRHQPGTSTKEPPAPPRQGDITR